MARESEREGRTERTGGRVSQSREGTLSNSTFWGNGRAATPVPAPTLVPALAPVSDPAGAPAYEPHYYETLIKRFDQLEARLDTLFQRLDTHFQRIDAYFQRQQEQHDAYMIWFGEQFASIHRYFQPPPPPPPDQGPSYD